MDSREEKKGTTEEIVGGGTNQEPSQKCEAIQLQILWHKHISQSLEDSCWWVFVVRS